MRAAYSAGALATLVEYGFEGVFDHVVGSSAGAMNGAYFLASQADAVETYTDDISNKNFVNLTRKDKRVDIDYLVDVALLQKRPLKIDRLLKTHSRLHLVLTDAQTGKSFVISDHQKFVQIYEEMRATAALPILYDKKIVLNGKEYVDGGVSNLLPIDIAVSLGCTDIIVIMTQQISSYRFDLRHRRLINHLIRKLARNQSKKVQDILPTNEKALKANLKLATHPPKAINIYTLQPSNEEYLISTATIDKEKVKELAKLGVLDMEEFLHYHI